MCECGHVCWSGCRVGQVQLWDKEGSLVTSLEVVGLYSLDERHLLRNRHNCCSAYPDRQSTNNILTSTLISNSIIILSPVFHKCESIQQQQKSPGPSACIQQRAGNYWAGGGQDYLTLEHQFSADLVLVDIFDSFICTKVANN